MKRKLLLACAIFAATFSSQAQTTDLGKPISWKSNFRSDKIETKVMSGFDANVVAAEDAINDQNKSQPWRFGYKYDTDFTLENSGTWETLSDGSKLWRLGLKCEGAITMNLLLEDLFIPEGASLYLFDVDKTNKVGAYTARNNREDGNLGTELLHGDEIIVEYHEPANVAGEGSLTVSSVVHGYRTLTHIQNELTRALNSSGDCNIDVHCSLGDPWSNQIRSVAMIVVNGNGACTGALINNTCNDGTPYFLTANHCLGGSTGNWAFRFNWEVAEGDPTLSCATTTNTSSSYNLSSNFDQTANGATLLANSGTSDFALLKIDNMDVNDAINWGLFYAGWDNTDVESTVSQVVGIHHPAGDIKKICRAFDNGNNISHQSVSGTDVWFMNSWDDGVTEGGSSGSPLFDQNGRIIGQLYGGAAACSGTSNNGQYDFYGRFGVSWDLGVKQYLSPASCGAEQSINDGYDPNPGTSSIEEISSNLFAVSPNPSTGMFTVQLEDVATDARITVLDMTGRIISTEKLTYGVSSLLDLTSAANGTYIIRLNSSLGSEMKTIVVNK
ncbi:MAG: trypsin-like peptidase domain-containing protein [Flavobacteriales bacterium]|nr:trypsin-like peptidase domain-containing protein [Flavobacteriales bacterium]